MDYWQTTARGLERFDRKDRDRHGPAQSRAANGGTFCFKRNSIADVRVQVDLSDSWRFGWGTLTRRGVRRCQLRVRGRPDSSDAASGTDEQRRRCQAHESQEERIFNQVLTLFVMNKVVEKHITMVRSKMLHVNDDFG